MLATIISLLGADDDGSRGTFLIFFFGGFILMTIGMMFFAMHMRKIQLREKKEKREQKMQEERERLDLEIKKQRADFELDQVKAASMPVYCKYCGCKNTATAKFCEACGAGMKS
jgi:membrane protease subunit (stomatin/prohibitin family)